MAPEQHDDRPRASWNDRKSMILDIHGFQRRYTRTKDEPSAPTGEISTTGGIPLEGLLKNDSRVPYVILERAIPSHMTQRPRSGLSVSPALGKITLDRNQAVGGSTVTVSAEHGVSSIVGVYIGDTEVPD